MKNTIAHISGSVLIIPILFLITSCAVKIDATHQHVRGSDIVGKYESQKVKTIVENNNIARQWYKDNEWKYNRKNKQQGPKQCLALSGGGIRSASFSIGVLKGLKEKGILNNIDIISAVSGGSYALSWYYVQQYKFNSFFMVDESVISSLEARKGKLSEEVLNSLNLIVNQKYKTKDNFVLKLDNLFKDINFDNYRNDLIVLARRSNGDDALFTDKYLDGLSSKSRMYGFHDMAGTTLANIVMSPFNLLLNGIFSGNINTTSQRAYYEHVIQRTFHSAIDEPFLDVDMLYMDSISFSDMNDFVRSSNLPYFIINTSADIDDDRNHYKSRLKNSVFEFTPIRMGSDGFGYKNDMPPDYPISLAVSVSGAVLDSTEVPGKFNSLLTASLNLDLGYYVENYNENANKNRVARKITPFPLYYLWGEDPHRRDLLGMDIYLTDGGHTENLGAYSLVRRSCDHIIIVDAEYDNEYEFESYNHLKKALLSEMQVDLVVKDFEGDRKLWKDNKKPDAVEKGKIKYLIDLNTKGEAVYKEIDVTYIKLAINKDLFDDANSENNEKAKRFYGEQLVKYYVDSENNDCGQLLISCEFPQYTTSDQSYSNEQFRAYINLGYSIVKNTDKLPEVIKN